MKPENLLEESHLKRLWKPQCTLGVSFGQMLERSQLKMCSTKWEGSTVKGFLMEHCVHLGLWSSLSLYWESPHFPPAVFSSAPHSGGCQSGTWFWLHAEKERQRRKKKKCKFKAHTTPCKLSLFFKAATALHEQKAISLSKLPIDWWPHPPF